MTCRRYHLKPVSTIAAYQSPADIELSVHRADAFSIEADLAVIGRCREVRARLEEETNQRFEPYFETSVPERETLLLRSQSGPWSCTVALDYRPRNVRTRPLPTTEFGFPCHISHLHALTSNLGEILQRCHEDFETESVLFLPLSWRNPQVVSLAAVGAAWHYCYWIARELGAFVEPSDHFVETLEETLLDLLGISAEDWQRHQRTMLQERAESLRRKGYIKRFMFVDRDDPQPFVDALENRDNRLVEAFEIDPEDWTNAALTRIAP